MRLSMACYVILCLYSLIFYICVRFLCFKQNTAYDMRISDWSSDVCSSDLKTIVKVASEIVRQQEDFFRKGVEHLKPLTLKAVADAIQMHESTVSRVTSNKYLSCPRGLYELKYFFTSGVSAADRKSTRLNSSH